MSITLTGANTIDFSGGNLYQIFGYDSDTVLSAGVNESPRFVDLTRGVSDISIECSLVASSYSNGKTANVLYSFVPNVGQHKLIDITPTQRVYNRISERGGENISRIQMKVVDNLGRRVNLNNEAVSYLLHIRKVKH